MWLFGGYDGSSYLNDLRSANLLEAPVEVNEVGVSENRGP